MKAEKEQKIALLNIKTIMTENWHGQEHINILVSSLMLLYF
jgi:hypothetical protein